MRFRRSSVLASETADRHGLCPLLPFALGYLLSYLLRAVNAVAAPDLVAEFKLSASELGLLTSAYLGAFALVQFPLGIMLDRFGPRQVQAGLLGVAAAGTIAFAAAQDFLQLFLARALIGAGFACGLMASFKAVVLWVEAERRPLANASVMSFGGLGILIATEPTQILLGIATWRTVFAGFAGLIVVLALAIYFIVPERKNTHNAGPWQVEARQLFGILGTFNYWRVAPLLGLTAGVQIALQTLWAGPWFRDVMGLDRPNAARHLLWMALAFSLGIFLSGVVADRAGRRGIGPMSVYLGFFVLYVAAQLILIVQFLPLTTLAWLVMAAVGQTAILGFPWLQQFHDASLAGRVNATLNFAMFVVAFSAQYAIGIIIDQFPATPTGYPPEAYAWAFGGILALQLLAVGWYYAAPALMAAKAASARSRAAR
jgi:MFS family permease